MWLPGQTEHSGEKGPDQENSGHSGWAPDIECGDQPSLQHSTDLDFMAERPDGSHSSVQDARKLAWTLQKKNEGNAGKLCEIRQNIEVMETQSGFGQETDIIILDKRRGAVVHTC